MTARPRPVQRLASQPCADLPEPQRVAMRHQLWVIKRKIKTESTAARRMARRAGLQVPA